MPVIKPVSLDSADPQQKPILEGIQAKLGKVPNIYATIAHSPSTLSAMLVYSAGLKQGALSLKEIELIALAVGQVSECDYCIAAHTAIGKSAGLTAEEMVAARQVRSHDRKIQALLDLAIDITETQGRPAASVVDAFRKVGYSDGALVEVIAWVTYNVFTNYLNHIAETEVDFPAAPALRSGGCGSGCGCGD